MAKIESVLIFDLDETILSVNSFPHWARYMLAGRFGELSAIERARLSLRTFHILAGRKLKQFDHASTKRQLQKLWAEALEKDEKRHALYAFGDFLHGLVRPNMAGVLALVEQGEADAIMATAAAGEYAHHFGRMLGFRHVLATARNHEPDTGENRSEQKRDRVLAALQIEGWSARPRIFFTDHAEDLPLIKECKTVMWFGNDSDVATLQAQAPHVRIIDCLHIPDTDMVKLISA